MEDNSLIGVTSIVSSDISKSFDALYNSSERSNLATKWETLARFILPSQFLNFTAGNNETASFTNSRSRKQVYDDMARLCARDLCSIIYNSLVNEAFNLMAFTVTDKDRKKMSAISRQWLQQAEETLKVEISSEKSLFARALRTSIISSIVFGSCCLQCEPKIDVDKNYFGIKYEGISVGRSAWTIDAFSNPNIVGVFYDLPASAIIAQWPEVKTPQILKDDKEGSTIFHRINQYVYPNKDRRTAFEWDDQVNIQRAYHSVTYIKDSKELLEENYFYDKPFKIARWTLAPSEVYGSSPSIDVLPTILSANVMSYIFMLGAEKMVDPPMAIPKRDMFSDINVNPRSLNYVEDPSLIRPINLSISLQPITVALKEMQDRIYKAYYLDKLILAPRNEQGEMTREETLERSSIAQKVIGSILDCFLIELFDATIKSTFNILLRNRVISEPPAEFKNYLKMKKRDSKGIKNSIWDTIIIEYKSILTRNKSLDKLQSIQGWIQDLDMIAQSGHPEIMDKVDPDAIADTVAEARGIPLDIVASDKIIASIREKREKAEEAQQQAEANAKNADATSKNAKAQSLSQPDLGLPRGQ